MIRSFFRLLKNDSATALSQRSKRVGPGVNAPAPEGNEPTRAAASRVARPAVTVRRDERPFNFAALNNAAVAEARKSFVDVLIVDTAGRLAIDELTVAAMEAAAQADVVIAPGYEADVIDRLIAVVIVVVTMRRAQFAVVVVVEDAVVHQGVADQVHPTEDLLVVLGPVELDVAEQLVTSRRRGR